MIFPKKEALFMLIVNTAFIVLCIIRFFSYHETLFIDINKPPLDTSTPIYQWLTNSAWLLNFIIFIGLYRVLIKFSERFWIKLSVVIFLILKLLIIILLVTVSFNPQFSITKGYSMFKMINGVNIVINLNMSLSFLFIRDPVIKKYYMIFAILMFITYFFQYLGPTLYDDFSQRWAWINLEMLICIAHVSTLFLWAKLFGLANKNYEITAPKS